METIGWIILIAMMTVGILYGEIKVTINDNCYQWKGFLKRNKNNK